jgi:hypothetical protein
VVLHRPATGAQSLGDFLSSALAVAVDEAQYAEQAGPCLEPLHTGVPAPVPDIAATMVWPGFRDQAVKIGLRASVSIPLYAGSGAPWWC